MTTRRDVGMQKHEELVESFERELEGAPQSGTAPFVASGKMPMDQAAWPEPYRASGKMHDTF